MSRFSLPPAPARVLDVGAAAGHNSVALTAAGYEVVAVEIEAPLAAQAGAHGVVVTVADGTRLPLRQGLFDAAVLIEVFEHVPDPASLMAELARVLRPGGRVCVAVPTGYTERVFACLHPRYSQNAGHLHSYRRSDVERVFDAAGFAIVEVRTENLDPAISWFFHSLLRSDSDQTGAILEHHWVDGALRVLLGAWRRTPVLRRLYRFLDGRVGKSWYLVGERR